MNLNKDETQELESLKKDIDVSSSEEKENICLQKIAECLIILTHKIGRKFL